MYKAGFSRAVQGFITINGGPGRGTVANTAGNNGCAAIIGDGATASDRSSGNTADSRSHQLWYDYLFLQLPKKQNDVAIKANKRKLVITFFITIKLILYL